MSQRKFDPSEDLWLNDLGREEVEKRVKALPEDVFNKVYCIYLDRNGFEKIPDWLKKFPNLEVLDLKINHITKLEGLGSLTELRELSIEENQIKKIEGLDNLKNLKYLTLGESYHYLGGNEVRKIENLESLHNLEILELANNKIQKIEGLDSLQNLIELDLAYNQIEVIEGLDGLSNLRKLHLNENQIQHLDLSVIPPLEELDLSGNPINSITDFKSVKKIETFFIDPSNCDPLTQEKFHENFGRYEFHSKIK